MPTPASTRETHTHTHVVMCVVVAMYIAHRVLKPLKCPALNQRLTRVCPCMFDGDEGNCGSLANFQRHEKGHYRSSPTAPSSPSQLYICTTTYRSYINRYSNLCVAHNRIYEENHEYVHVGLFGRISEL